MHHVELWAWGTGQRPVPAHIAPALSAATGGAVSVAELLYPDGLPAGAVLAPGLGSTDGAWAASVVGASAQSHAAVDAAMRAGAP